MVRVMRVLITGGAGYISSAIASACLGAGISPVILNSLVTGRREFAAGREFYEGDIADGPLVHRIFAEHPDICAVIHCAALIVVPDSVADPVGYYRANVAKGVAGAYTRSDRAKRLLGWVPRYDLAEGIRHSLQWAAIRDRILSG
jgi:UDP-glucose 4-epimerase